MSTESYQKWWIKVKAGLEHVKGYDDAMKKMRTVKDRPTAGALVGGMYARYSMIVQEMDACLDQMCQVQKGFTVRKLMDAATSRLHELKDDLTKIDISEFHYIDGNLVELKLIPHSVEILHPALMHPRPDEIEQLWKRIKLGETIYIPPPPEEIQANAPVHTEAPSAIAALLNMGKQEAKKEVVIVEKEEEIIEEIVEEVEEISPEEQRRINLREKRIKNRPKPFLNPLDDSSLSPEELAILKKVANMKQKLILIQAHERARASRLYYNDLYIDWYARKNPPPPGTKLPPPPPQEIFDDAATKIQTIWRGYQSKSYMKRRELQRRLVIGMTEPSWKSNAEFEKMEHNLEKRRAIRDQNIRDYIKSNLDEKERVLRVIGPGLFEDIGDEIRENFHHWWYTIDEFEPRIPAKARAFDKFPTVEKGGSILMVRCEVTTPEEFIREHMKQSKNKKKEKAKAKAEAAKKKKQEEEAKKKKKEKEKKEKEKKKIAEAKRKKRGEFEYAMEPTIGDAKYIEGCDEYKALWSEIIDADNPLERHYMNIITEEKCYRMQLELRLKVDELMRLELNILMESLEDFKWRMKGKRTVRKPKKPKKEKKKGKKGKKGKKDPTGNRTIEDLFQELVDNGIIHPYPKVRLEEYRGDFSYNNWEFRNVDLDPPATLGDVRQAVLMNCILPLGVTEMAKPKSVLIAGARQSGKHLLANAIFYESKCVLFDLSMAVLAGKYPGKKGMAMLVHLINKVSRLLQPSIIFIDGAEKPWYKKVPKPEKALEPKRIGKVLFKKIIKVITPADRVLVLGITGQPHVAAAAGLKKAFQRVILIPRTDYGSVFLYWREQLMPYHGVDRNFDVSAITKVTVKFPLSEISTAIKTVLVPRRIIQLKQTPLLQAELLEALLLGQGPVIDKEYNKITKWFNKTPLAKERAKFIKIQTIRREKENKNKKK